MKDSEYTKFEYKIVQQAQFKEADKNELAKQFNILSDEQKVKLKKRCENYRSAEDLAYGTNKDYKIALANLKEIEKAAKVIKKAEAKEKEVEAKKQKKIDSNIKEINKALNPNKNRKSFNKESNIYSLCVDANGKLDKKILKSLQRDNNVIDSFNDAKLTAEQIRTLKTELKKVGSIKWPKFKELFFAIEELPNKDKIIENLGETISSLQKASVKASVERSGMAGSSAEKSSIVSGQGLTNEEMLKLQGAIQNQDLNSLKFGGDKEKKELSQYADLYMKANKSQIAELEKIPADMKKHGVHNPIQSNDTLVGRANENLNLIQNIAFQKSPPFEEFLNSAVNMNVIKKEDKGFIRDILVQTFGKENAIKDLSNTALMTEGNKIKEIFNAAGFDRGKSGNPLKLAILLKDYAITNNLEPKQEQVEEKKPVIGPHSEKAVKGRAEQIEIKPGKGLGNKEFDQVRHKIVLGEKFQNLKEDEKKNVVKQYKQMSERQRTDLENSCKAQGPMSRSAFNLKDIKKAAQPQIIRQ